MNRASRLKSPEALRHNGVRFNRRYATEQFGFGSATRRLNAWLMSAAAKSAKTKASFFKRVLTSSLIGQMNIDRADVADWG
jgi:hypothetical protein